MLTEMTSELFTGTSAKRSQRSRQLRKRVLTSSYASLVSGLTRIAQGFAA